MKVINLTAESRVYTSNVFLVLGSGNAVGDVNTLIDVGTDTSVIDKINKILSNVSKKPIKQVVLTHSHNDHAAILPLVRKAYNPIVYAFSRHIDGVDYFLKNGEKMKIGDKVFEVIHTPGHSSDSICLYCKQEGVLFAGDAHLIVWRVEDTYEDAFVRALKKLSQCDIRSVYVGHGDPPLEDYNSRINTSLKKLEQAGLA